MQKKDREHFLNESKKQEAIILHREFSDIMDRILRFETDTDTDFDGSKDELIGAKSVICSTLVRRWKALKEKTGEAQ